MRIKLSNPERFFDEILQKNKESLKQLSKKNSFNYSNLKQYRRGEKTMPDFIFNALIWYSPRVNFWLNDCKKFEDNWGSLKGGTIAGKMPDAKKRANYARSFRKITKVNIKTNKFFCEFYGALLGDGCICKFKDYEAKERFIIQFSGNRKLDSQYIKYLQNKLKKEYDLYSYYYEPKGLNVCTLSIRNKGLCLELNKRFDVPIGLKYKKIKISDKILALPWSIKRFVLRGLFDTDGCILANKREKYRYPWITISSKSKKFRDQLIKMLREQNYPAYNTRSDVCVRGIANVKRWFSDIGSSNSRNILKYEYFLKHGYLPAGLLTGSYFNGQNTPMAWV